MINMTIKKKQITGVMVQYYKVCTRELWFYLHQVNMNYDNDDIEIGKLIHENSYKREKKEIRIDNIVFDFIKDKDTLTVCEIKKSSKLTIGGHYQLYYYLYTLKNANIKAEGEVVYPKERKKEKLTLTPEKEKEIQEILTQIQEISKQKQPPKAKTQAYCKKCTYYELCMI